MSISEARRLKALEGENRQLRRLVPDLSLDNQILRNVLKTTFNAQSEASSDGASDLLLWAISLLRFKVAKPVDEPRFIDLFLFGFEYMSGFACQNSAH